jgi:hypothetical protein
MYFKNIVEYFDSCHQPIDLTNKSTFYKEAYAVYLRYKQNDTTLDIEKECERLKSLPISYSEMRCFFG